MNKNIKIFFMIILLVLIISFIITIQLSNRSKEKVGITYNESEVQAPIQTHEIYKPLSEKEEALKYGYQYKNKSYIANNNEIRAYESDKDNYEVVYTEKLKIGNGYDIDTDVFRIADIIQNKLIFYIMGSDSSPGPCFDPLLLEPENRLYYLNLDKDDGIKYKFTLSSIMKKDTIDKQKQCEVDLINNNL